MTGNEAKKTIKSIRDQVLADAVKEQNGRLLTPAEAGELLGVTSGTLQVWRATKRYPIPYTKVGRKVMYPLAGLTRFIEQRTVAGSAA